MEILIETLYEERENGNDYIPKKGNDKASCYDVICKEVLKISPNKIYCKLGFKSQIPKGYKAVLIPRSNLTKFNWIMNNSPGQVDEDFRGEWQMRFTGIPIGISRRGDYGTILGFEYDIFPYKKGDRIGQMYIAPVVPINFVAIGTVDKTERGTGGYGSTGL